MISCYDLTEGEAHVQNCQASDWSVCVSLVTKAYITWMSDKSMVEREVSVV